jgi:hypothetical protein
MPSMIRSLLVHKGAQAAAQMSVTMRQLKCMCPDSSCARAGSREIVAHSYPGSRLSPSGSPQFPADSHVNFEACRTTTCVVHPFHGAACGKTSVRPNALVLPCEFGEPVRHFVQQSSRRLEDTGNRKRWPPGISPRPLERGGGHCGRVLAGSRSWWCSRRLC